MTKQLEEHSEFKFMEEEGEKPLSSMRCATDWMAAVSFEGASAIKPPITLFYIRVPSVHETDKVYTKPPF